MSLDKLAEHVQDSLHTRHLLDLDYLALDIGKKLSLAGLVLLLRLQLDLRTSQSTQ